MKETKTNREIILIKPLKILKIKEASYRRNKKNQMIKQNK